MQLGLICLEILEIYVCDVGNSLIRKITPEGQVTTLAGNGMPGHEDGIGTGAAFSFPLGIDVDPAGNVYVADGNSTKKGRY